MAEVPLKKVSDLLATFLDHNLSAKAERVSAFFGAWRRIAGERLSAHSSVVEVDRGIVMVEADHPSWIQLLQMKQEEMLRRIRADYPQLAVKGLAFRLQASVSPAAPAAPSGSGTLDRMADPEDRAGLQALALARAKMEELQRREVEAAHLAMPGPAPDELEPAKAPPSSGQAPLAELLQEFRKVVEERNAEEAEEPLH